MLFFLVTILFFWSSKRQHTLSCSSAQAEYRAVANGIAEVTWLHQLLFELRTPLCCAAVMYFDSVSAIYLFSNPVQHQCTKQVEMDVHFVCERVALGHVRILHVPTSSQFADIFTKGLPTSIFNGFQTSLNVRSPPARTTGVIDDSFKIHLGDQAMPCSPAFCYFRWLQIFTATI